MDYILDLYNCSGLLDIINSKQSNVNGELILNTNYSLNNHRIIHYDKNKLKFGVNAYIYKYCRSLVVNKNNKVICFSPPKSIKFDMFQKLYPEKTSDIIASEIIEGTMINVFWDPDDNDGNWSVSTKRILGASKGFYNKMTFLDMFLDALKYINLDLNDLDKSYCYSFVLQHPNNRIVIYFGNPNLYLISVFKITNHFYENSPYYLKSVVVTNIDTNIVKENHSVAASFLKFPLHYQSDSYDELIETYSSKNTNHYTVGVMFYNQVTGIRSKHINKNYLYVKELRGTHHSLLYNFIVLLKASNIQIFLYYYPEFMNTFFIYNNILDRFINTLYYYYDNCFVIKNMLIGSVPYYYKINLLNINKANLPYVENNVTLNINTINSYVYNMDTLHLFNCLNYIKKKYTMYDTTP